MDSDLETLAEQSRARHEAVIESALQDVERTHATLAALLRLEIANLRADARVFLSQRDAAVERVEEHDEAASEAHDARRKAEAEMRVAKSEAAKLRGLLHDLQREVAGWPRPDKAEPV